MESLKTCYHEVQNNLCSTLLYKNIKTDMYTLTKILSVVLYGREAWCFAMREEHTCLTTGCRGRHLGLRRTKKQENKGDCIMKRSIIGTSQHILVAKP
jgi:hypothetical protein